MNEAEVKREWEKAVAKTGEPTMLALKGALQKMLEEAAKDTTSENGTPIPIQFPKDYGIHFTVEYTRTKKD